MNKKPALMINIALLVFAAALAQPGMAKETLFATKPSLLLAAAKRAADTCEAEVESIQAYLIDLAWNHYEDTQMPVVH